MKKHNFSKAIGIVGGAGPAASSFLYSSILEICQKKYNASDYNEFPEIILISYPFTRGNGEKIREEIAACLSKLKLAGASIFCIASHSFHAFLPDVPKTGFVHLVNISLQEAARKHISKALILSAPITIQLKLYEQPPMQCVYPAPQEQLVINQLIREAAGGKIDKDQAHILKKLIAQIHERDPFNGVILACTELPLIHHKMPLTDTLPIVNTVEVLAEQLVSHAMG